MNFETQYTVSTDMQDASMRQSLFAVYLSPKKWLFVILAVVAVLFFFVSGPEAGWFRWLFAYLLIFVVGLWIRAYFTLRAAGRKRLSLADIPITKVKITDSEIESSTDTETRHFTWNKFDRVIETKDFLLVMSGKLSLFCLPKCHFPAEIQDYIKTRPNQTAHPTTL